MVLAAPARHHVQKKTLIADERERADVALARWLWHRGQHEIDPARLVFVDETGTATNMAPPHGWGPSCKRIVGHAPHGRWTRTTFVAGPIRSGFVAPMVMEGSMNAQVFQAWVERVLVPELPEGAIEGTR